MHKLYSIAGILLILTSSLHAACSGSSPNWTAASTSQSDVAACVTAATDGDTINVPAGTSTWTTNISTSKELTIKGLTTTDSIAGTYNDQTILVDNIVNGGQSFFFKFTANGSNVIRITGITFTGVGGSTTLQTCGSVEVDGLSSNVRIDHCHFNALYKTSNIDIEGAIFGVADHNIMKEWAGLNHSFYLNFPNYGGGSNDFGDGAFAEAAGFGGPKFFFVEDNYIEGATPYDGVTASVDMFYGAKLVWRHNPHCKNLGIFSHSTGKSAPRGRGVRAIEIYNNAWIYDVNALLPGISDGSIVLHDDTYAGTQPPKGFSLTVIRSYLNVGAPFYGADGTNVWDSNDVSDHTGNGYGGGPNGLYASGTITSSGNYSVTVTTGAGWTTNQWVGYVVKDTTMSSSAANNLGLIISNTATVLQVYQYQTLNWTGGDSYQIHKVIHALDDIGRSWGDLLSGDPPSVTGWPNQTHLEPCYAWNEVYTPTSTNLLFNNDSALNLTHGVDFIDDGTQMPGYTPYTYPHPLVTQTQGGSVQFGGSGPVVFGGSGTVTFQ